MKKLLILLALPELKILKEKLSNKSFEVELAEYKDISVRLAGEESQFFCKSTNLREFDYVWLHAPWNTAELIYAISKYLDLYAVKHTTVTKAESKLSDLVIFSINRIPVPLTYFFPNIVLRSKIEILEKNFSYPFIVKQIRGSLGNGVYIVNNRDEFLKLVKDLNGDKYVAQYYIPNDFDYRIIVGNNKILSGEKRIRKSGEFRNSAFLGAKEIFLNIPDIPSEVQDHALRSAKALNLDWAGVDIVVDKTTNKSYVLEVNRRPGLAAGSSEIQACEDFIAAIKHKI